MFGNTIQFLLIASKKYGAPKDDIVSIPRAYEHCPTQQSKFHGCNEAQELETWALS